MWVYTSGALFIQWFIGRVLVHENIMSAWEELFKRDEGQVRPMVRRPSVPLRLFMKYSRINRIHVLTL